MNSQEFLRGSDQVSRYIVDYLETIGQRPVVPYVEPGFMKHHIPLEAPTDPESWNDIFEDVEKKIMPGVAHWQHPGFFAYFPAGNSYPSILAGMVSDAIGCQCFSWAACPSGTELETIIMDWLAKMINLPKHFLYHAPESQGGGVLQSSASQCILVAMLTARNQALERLKKQHPTECPGVLLYKLVAYCSNQAHSSVTKASNIAFVNLRSLPTDDEYSLRGSELEQAIKEDIANGFFPFLVMGTLGTTSCCSFDNLTELGEVATKYKLWFHVDAAYAGAAFTCPEFHYLLKGIEYVDSFNTNPNKWMLTNFDCSAFWIKNRTILINTMTENATYLQHKNSARNEAIDYHNWDISLSRRFRSLKLWFVIRTYGISGIQNYIRNHVKLAKLFEQLVRQDKRFDVYGKVVMGLVCFRLKGSNHLNQELLEILNSSGKIHLVPATLDAPEHIQDFAGYNGNGEISPKRQLNGNQQQPVYVLRFAVCKENAQSDEIIKAWNFIKGEASRLIIVPRQRRSMIEELNTAQKHLSHLPIAISNTKFLDFLNTCKIRDMVAVYNVLNRQYEKAGNKISEERATKRLSAKEFHQIRQTLITYLKSCIKSQPSLLSILTARQNKLNRKGVNLVSPKEGKIIVEGNESDSTIKITEKEVNAGPRIPDKNGETGTKAAINGNKHESKAHPQEITNAGIYDSNNNNNIGTSLLKLLVIGDEEENVGPMLTTSQISRVCEILMKCTTSYITKPITKVQPILPKLAKNSLSDTSQQDEMVDEDDKQMVPQTRDNGTADALKSPLTVPAIKVDNFVTALEHPDAESTLEPANQDSEEIEKSDATSSEGEQEDTVPVSVWHRKKSNISLIISAQYHPCVGNLTHFHGSREEIHQNSAAIGQGVLANNGDIGEITEERTENNGQEEIGEGRSNRPVNNDLYLRKRWSAN